jgi:hypothetical protein
VRPQSDGGESDDCQPQAKLPGSGPELVIKQRQGKEPEQWIIAIGEGHQSDLNRPVVECLKERGTFDHIGGHAQYQCQPKPHCRYAAPILDDGQGQ